MSGNKGAEYIAKLISSSVHLEKFQMASSRVGNEGMRVLLEELCKHKNLKEVDISGNPTTIEIAPKILDLMKTNNDIRTLKIDDLGLTDDGINMIIKGIPKYLPNIEVKEV